MIKPYRRIILARPPAAILPFSESTLLPVFHNHRHTTASHHLGFTAACHHFGFTTTSHHLSHTAASHHFSFGLAFYSNTVSTLRSLPVEGFAVLTLPILEAPTFVFLLCIILLLLVQVIKSVAR
jgi:hypothetical protein